MNEIEKFADALQNDPSAKALMDSMDAPADDEKAIDAYIDLARKLGYTFSREDLVSWGLEKEKEFAARAEQAEAGMMEALDSEKMSMVAGGSQSDDKADPRCVDTFKRGEVCFLLDSCKYLYKYYKSP